MTHLHRCRGAIERSKAARALIEAEKKSKEKSRRGTEDYGEVKKDKEKSRRNSNSETPEDLKVTFSSFSQFIPKNWLFQASKKEKKEKTHSKRNSHELTTDEVDKVRRLALHNSHEKDKMNEHPKEKKDNGATSPETDESETSPPLTKRWRRIFFSEISELYSRELKTPVQQLISNNKSPTTRSAPTSPVVGMKTKTGRLEAGKLKLRRNFGLRHIYNRF
jgi:hypothetical protein